MAHELPSASAIAQTGFGKLAISAFELVPTNGLAFTFSVIGAFVLAMRRNRHQREPVGAQWLSDAFNCGTLALIPILIVKLYIGKLAGADPYVPSVALTYCMVVIFRDLNASSSPA